MTMKEFDAIIGYGDIKRELEQTADILTNLDLYEKAGARIPTGLLLHGEPGVGKSLMAECLIAASGLPVFTCRRKRSDDSFTDTIVETFDKAVEAAPAIVYLDDMDKFANNDSHFRDEPEFVAVQSSIDETKGKGIFIIATANDISRLPESLVRAGRFDRMILVEAPGREQATKIIAHYLEGKPLAGDLDPSDIAALLEGETCAELESILNEALIVATGKRESTITRDSFMEAYLKRNIEIPYGDSDSDSNWSGSEDSASRKRVALHEAGHAAISELLSPSSVALVTAFRASADRSGICRFCKPTGISERNWTEMLILGTLGSMAATDIVRGELDEGVSSDLAKAASIIKGGIASCGTAGFGVLDSPTTSRLSGGGAGWVKETRQSAIVEAELERYYWQAKRILALNRPFLDALTSAIEKNDYLIGSDIRAIRAQCGLDSLPIDLSLIITAA